MMKNLIFLVLLLSTFPLFSQNIDNEQRILELPALIEDATINENYILASKLQYELEYRENLKEAVDTKDYSAAAHWQNELNLLLGIKKEIPGKRPAYKDRYPTNKLFISLDLSALGYSHLNYTETNFSTYPQTEQPATKFGATANFKFGIKYFFNNEKKSRIGIDLSILSVQPSGLGKRNSMNNGMMSFFRPGLIYGYFLTPTSGFDVQLNVGPALYRTFDLYENRDRVGIIIVPHLRYWFGHFSLGVEYNYGNLIKEQGDYNSLFFTFGFRL